MTEYIREIIEVLEWAQEMNAKDEDAWYPTQDVVHQIRPVAKDLGYDGMEPYMDASFSELWSDKAKARNKNITIMLLEEIDCPYGGDEGGYALVQIEHGKTFELESKEKVAELILTVFGNDCTGCCDAVKFVKVGEHATLMGINVAQTLHS